MHTPTAFITGCSSGIGLASATLLHQQGWHVLAGVRKAKDMPTMQAAGFTPIHCDLNDPEAISQSIQQVLHASGGPLDALINNAGYAQLGAFEDLHPDALKQQFQTNVFGLHQLTQGLLPTMRQQGHGRIVMVSSILGLVSLPHRGAYNASKHALEALASALRMELHGSGICVSVIQPGPIKSRFRDNARAAFETSPLHQQQHQAHYESWRQAHQIKARIPGSLGPETVAKCCLNALTHPRPKHYYKVTLPAYLLATLQNCLPSRTLDALFRISKL